MTKVVGFDLDDTLVAEALFLKSGAFHIAAWLHQRFKTISLNRVISCVMTAVRTHQNHYSALERLIEEYGLSESIDMKELVAEFRNHNPDPTIYHPAPSMIQTLKELKNNPDIKLVLITDGRSLTQRNKINCARLDEYFEDNDIYISEETGHDKTYPDTFLHIMEKYAGAREFHYVGDNPAKDFLHPSKLGWQTHLIHRFPLIVHHGMPK